MGVTRSDCYLVGDFIPVTRHLCPCEGRLCGAGDQLRGVDQLGELPV